MSSDVNRDTDEQILHERAVALARERGGDDEAGERADLTVFLLGSERFAFESSLIREVVACREYTPLPCVPPFIAGIMNLRGRILSLLDLRRLLELPGEGMEEGMVLVLSHGGMEFGVLAARIEGNASIPLSRLQEEFPALGKEGGRYLWGVTAERLVVLDALKLLNDPSLVVNEEIG
jgi:purine-binding chemotaxis protein CheW